MVQAIIAILASVGACILAAPFFKGRRINSPRQLVLRICFLGRARQAFWGLAGVAAALLLALAANTDQLGVLLLAAGSLLILLLPQQYAFADEGLLLNGRLLASWDEFSGFFADDKYIVLFGDKRADILWGQSAADETLLKMLQSKLPRTRSITRCALTD